MRSEGRKGGLIYRGWVYHSFRLPSNVQYVWPFGVLLSNGLKVVGQTFGGFPKTFG